MHAVRGASHALRPAYRKSYGQLITIMQDKRQMRVDSGGCQCLTATVAEKASVAAAAAAEVTLSTCDGQTSAAAFYCVDQLPCQPLLLCLRAHAVVQVVMCAFQCQTANEHI